MGPLRHHQPTRNPTKIAGQPPKPLHTLCSNTTLVIEHLVCTRPWAQYFPPVLSFCSLFCLNTAPPHNPGRKTSKHIPHRLTAVLPTTTHTTFLFLFPPLTHSPHMLASHCSLDRKHKVPPQGLCVC